MMFARRVVMLLPMLVLLSLARRGGAASDPDVALAAAARAAAAAAAPDTDKTHAALLRCAALEEAEDADDDEAEACLQATGDDASLPCGVRALALVRLSLSLTSKKKGAVLRQAMEACPEHPDARVALARALAKRRETRPEVIPLLESGLPRMASQADLATLYHNIGLAHRVVGNWEAGVNALRVAMDLAPTDAAMRADMLAVLTAWQGVALNQTDLFEAPIFTKPFNKKGLRPVRLPPVTPKELAAKKGRVVRAYRQNAYPRIVTVDTLIEADEAVALHSTALALLDDEGDAAAAAKKKLPSPVWCFSSPQVLLDLLAQHEQPADLLGPVDVLAGLAGHVGSNATGGTPFSEESAYRCLSAAASAALTAAGFIRYSRTHNVYRGESALLDEIEERIEGGLGLAAAHGAKWQITSYDHGEGYAAHTDCVVGESVGGSSFDRVATVLVYLTDVAQGGETSFTKIKPAVSVTPKAGRMLLWRNTNAEGECDRMTAHRSETVAKGRKIIAQRWYYKEAKSLMNFRPGPPPLSYYRPGTPLIACDAVDSCRQYNDWTVDWANWKGFRSGASDSR